MFVFFGALNEKSLTTPSFSIAWLKTLMTPKHPTFHRQTSQRYQDISLYLCYDFIPAWLFVSCLIINYLLINIFHFLVKYNSRKNKNVKTYLILFIYQTKSFDNSKNRSWGWAWPSSSKAGSVVWLKYVWKGLNQPK